MSTISQNITQGQSEVHQIYEQISHAVKNLGTEPNRTVVGFHDSDDERYAVAWETLRNLQRTAESCTHVFDWLSKTD